MRAKSTILVIALGVLFLLPSCSKKSQEEMVLSSVSSDQVISATVSYTSGYELPVGTYGNVSIHKQAKHFEHSVAAVDAKSGSLMYKYLTEKSYRGKDEVVLKSEKTVRGYSGSSGCNMGESAYSYDRVVSSYVTIRFTVVD